MTAIFFAAWLGFLLVFTSLLPADVQELTDVQSLPDSLVRAKAEFDSHLKLANERYLLEHQDALKRLTMSWESEIERAKQNRNQELADALVTEWKSVQAALGDPAVGNMNLAGSSESAGTADSSNTDKGSVGDDSSSIDSASGMFAEFLAPLQKAFNDAELGETQDRRDVLRERTTKRIESRFGGKPFSVRLPIASVKNTEGDNYLIRLEPIPIAGVEYFYGGRVSPVLEKGFHLNSRTLTMKRSEAEIVSQGGWLEVSGRMDPVIHRGAEIEPYRKDSRHNCFPIFTVALNSDFMLTISLYDEKVKHIPLDARADNGN